MKLIWLPETKSDIQCLYDFLIDKGPRSAERAVRVIQDGAQQLLQFPRLGQDMDDGTDRRELIVRFGVGAYVLRYRLHEEGMIVVIRVWHSREARP